MNQDLQNRIFGLDLLRSIAILLVVFAHSSHLLESYTSFPFISLPDGVDLFFVLSGFLIGNILLKLLEGNSTVDSKMIFGFLKRRWFRTLPNYFFVLLLNIVLIQFDLIKGFLNKFLVTYFFFFQNFHKPYDFLFWESWSLAVEEWFYLLFPILLFILYFFLKEKWKKTHLYLLTVLSFIFFPLLYRLTQIDPSTDFDLYTRKLVLTRLDTIGFGLLMAYIYRYHQELLQKIKTPLFFIGITILFFLVNLDKENSFFHQTFFYSLIGISIAILIPLMVSWKNENIRLKPFRFISIISYSMYLLHVPLLQIISNQMSDSNVLLVYSLFWILTVLLSYLLYRFFEKPFTQLREKF